MLFRTVTGPELEAIYQFVLSKKRAQKREIYTMFVPQAERVSAQSAEDAIAFLLSTGLVQEENGTLSAVDLPAPTFKLSTLCIMRSLELGQETPRNALDSLYFLILNRLFIAPDVLYLADVHTAANSLREVQAVGGLSKEKIGAWKRVMEYLGVGYRAFNGFVCVYHPTLTLDILSSVSWQQNTLQSLFEDHFCRYLPYERQDGDIAQAVTLPLVRLAQQNLIQLTTLQDSPTKTYFGRQKLRGITRKVFYA